MGAGAGEAGLNFIRLAAPTTDARRLPAVLANTSGFLYYVSIAGITGTVQSADGLSLPGVTVTVTRSMATVAQTADGYDVAWKAPSSVGAVKVYAGTDPALIMTTCCPTGPAARNSAHGPSPRTRNR